MLWPLSRFRPPPCSRLSRIKTRRGPRRCPPNDSSPTSPSLPLWWSPPVAPGTSYRRGRTMCIARDREEEEATHSVRLVDFGFKRAWADEPVSAQDLHGAMPMRERRLQAVGRGAVVLGHEWGWRCAVTGGERWCWDTSGAGDARAWAANSGWAHPRTGAVWCSTTSTEARPNAWAATLEVQILASAACCWCYMRRFKLQWRGCVGYPWLTCAHADWRCSCSIWREVVK
jgi:hypothetical protein